MCTFGNGASCSFYIPKMLLSPILELLLIKGNLLCLTTICLLGSHWIWRRFKIHQTKWDHDSGGSFWLQGRLVLTFEFWCSCELPEKLILIKLNNITKGYPHLLIQMDCGSCVSQRWFQSLGSCTALSFSLVFISSFCSIRRSFGWTQHILFLNH